MEEVKKERKKRAVNAVNTEAAATGIRNYRTGEIESVNYVKDANGFISWKDMIPDDFIVLNRAIYAAEGKDLELLDEAALAEEKAKAPENRKLIKLGGLKHVARLRGIKSQRYTLVNRLQDSATVSCEIEFLPNEENPMGLTVSALAQASLDNVGGEFAKYLDVIASNRAFTRCIREALHILILGQEEIQDEKPVIANKPGSPLELIRKKTQEKNLGFGDVIELLQKAGIDVKEEWVNFESFPTPIILQSLTLIKEI